jgi:hypothetical protein
MAACVVSRTKIGHIARSIEYYATAAPSQSRSDVNMKGAASAVPVRPTGFDRTVTT